MYRFLTVSLVSAFLALEIPAVASTIEFTYAEGELFGYGQGLKENIDVAICIDNPSLAGMEIKGFKAYLSGIDGFENTSLWMSKELKLVDKKNVPDIASYDVTPVLTEYGGGNLGMLSIDLPVPYILDGKPLYLGYSLTVADNTTMEEKYPIVVSEGSNPNGFFLHMSRSVLKWMDYSKKAGGVAYIVVTLEGDIREYSLGISDYTEANVLVSEDYSVELFVNNNGRQPITEVKYTYTYDNDTEKFEGLSTLPVAIEPEVTTSLPLTLEFKGIDTIGPHTLNVTITEVNGQPNESTTASKECLINVMPYSPVHRPLVEEFTGLWCGWCPRGWVGMEKLGEIYGDDVVVICYHNGDGMAVTNTYPVNFDGYPNASINRTAIIDPYYGSYDESYDFGIAYDVENSMAEMTIADLMVDAKLDGDIVNVNTSVVFMKDVQNANYLLGYVLNCNGLFKLSWLQANYYAGLESEFKGTYLEEMTQYPSKIAGLTFNDVAVDVSGMNGIEDSLPSTIKTGEMYNHSYSFNIEGNSLVQDKDNLVVTAFVIDKNTGAIINANKYDFAKDAGVNDLYEDVSAVSTEYYDLSGRKVRPTGKGIVIKKERMSDGTVRTSKIAL